MPEHAVALYSATIMAREIARIWPHVEFLGTWTCPQSSLNTDGAQSGDQPEDRARGYPVAQLFPDGRGLYVTLERTLFAETAAEKNLRLGEFNSRVDGSFPSPVPHRSGRADFPHPVPHGPVSLMHGSTLSRLEPALPNDAGLSIRKTRPGHPHGHPGQKCVEYHWAEGQ
ncbi:hypothetical protein [Paenirhodobacter sp.]|uniref:hypothetical protein n=1 Tax=Paenirhodobacter sp. TaxID=1965326 RepID=UPI003B3C02D3